MIRRDPVRAAARGFTLVELVAAMAISSVLFLSLATSVFIATRSVPDKKDPLIASVKGAQLLDQISAELETAVSFSEFSSRSIAFTVADRDNDGRSERIAYSWSGVAGDPLVRTYNGSAWTVLDSVTTFNLVANLQYAVEEYTNPGAEDLLASTLQDNSALLNTGTEKFNNNNTVNLGQYFNPTFSSDVIGYRPTSVTVWAQLDRVPGSYRVQLRDASASLIPRDTVLEERTVNSSILLIVALPQAYSFTSVGRQAPTNPLCLTLMWNSGIGPGRFQTTRSSINLLKTTSGPSDWQVLTDRSLSSLLTGYPMRDGTRRTATTQYLLGVGITLGVGATAAPVMQASAQTLNHPELVGGLWEIDFTRDPTTLDVNGDGVTDWAVTSGSGFGGGRLADQVWSATSDSVATQPASDFSGVTIVDLRMQATAPNAVAGFSINAARVGDRVIGITAALKLNADGTQSLTINQATGSSTTEQVIAYNLLPAQPTDLRLIIDPDSMGLTVRLNGAHRGTFPVAKATVVGSSPTASLYATGGGAQFSYARVRVLRAAP